MTDLRLTIAPKSDQMNSDDLIAGPRTITVTRVSLCGEAEQPVAINFDGDNGKPYKPCKSMRRVLVSLWGPDGNAYAGRSMTLYRDDKVQFGGLAVGGIRISHMSHIDRDMTMALTATRANRKPFTVRPLVAEAPAKSDRVESGARALVESIKAAADMADLEALTAGEAVIKQRTWLTRNRPDLAQQIDAALSDALASFDQPAEQESAQ
jgi:hypothetical protein